MLYVFGRACFTRCMMCDLRTKQVIACNMLRVGKGCGPNGTDGRSGGSQYSTYSLSPCIGVFVGACVDELVVGW